MDKNHPPIIAISLGDPNGIGPEIIFKSLARKDIQGMGTFVIFAPANLFAHYRNTFEAKINYTQIKSLEEIRYNKINLLHVETEDLRVEFGTSSEIAGKISFESLKQATQAVKEGKCDVLVTAPINKANIQSEEFKFPGHTEYLEEVWGGNNLMFMVHENIKVGLVTQHIPLKEVSKDLNKDAIKSKLDLMKASLQNDFGIREPKIAVMGLNPHAGDRGLLGKEEDEIIIPVIREKLNHGMKVFGPFPSDSFFGAENLKKYDAVLAMYHDQGLIPFKTLAGIEGVNYTAGLPFVRTSPDHGVGYDIADQFIADETSMVEAIYAAVDIFENRREMLELTENALQPDETSRKSRKSARFE